MRFHLPWTVLCIGRQLASVQKLLGFVRQGIGAIPLIRGRLMV